MPGSSTGSKAQSKPTPEALVCKLLIPLTPQYPSYHFTVSTTHPDLSFLLLTRMEMEKRRILEDIMVTGTFEKVQLQEEIRGAKGVHEVEIMESQGNTTVFRVLLDETPFTAISRDLHLLLRYPSSFEGGMVKIVVVSSKAKIQQLFERMRKVVPETKILAIKHENVIGPKSLLTDRQRTVFRVAMDAGYWDVPRRASLADVAQLMNLSKSTISETLSGIESKLVQEAKVEHVLL